MTEYVHVGQHADVLSSGLGIGPSDRVNASDLSDADQHLLDDEVLVLVSSFGGDDNRLSKADLAAKAADLEIEGRSKMTVDELRAAVAERESDNAQHEEAN